MYDEAHYETPKLSNVALQVYHEIKMMSHNPPRNNSIKNGFAKVCRVKIDRI